MISREGFVKIATKHIEKFALIVGDKNPVHTDPVFASKTRFKTPIAHGMFVMLFMNQLMPPRL